MVINNSGNNHYDEHEYRTSKTSLAAYLVQEGFEILITEYDEKGKGTFVFDNTSEELAKCVRLFNRGEANENIIIYEHARISIIDLVKRGLP